MERLKAALGDRYAVERPVGQGGMAIVYLARDLKHDRPVALKVLRSEFGVPAATERFLREIGIAARLQHPNILPIYDSGGAEQSLYYVMPFVEGESLRQRLERDHRLPLAEAVQITCEVAEALSYAHSQQVVHRDIKPENILLYRGHAMVADFGIAKAMQEAGADRLTETGLVLGTPIYMSPEQAFSEAEVSARTDQYSLACVLFEMLAGEPPFAGGSALGILTRKSTAPAPRISLQCQAVPDSIELIVLKALDRNPEDRYADISQFSESLSQALSNRTPDRSSQRHPEPSPGRSIAVLPFDNMSPSPDDDYLSDGISEDLIHALVKLPGLRVVARTSAFAFKGKNLDVRTIGRELGISSLLAGSLLRVGNRLRITAQLVECSDGFELWSERYDVELTDVFQVQDEISRAIVHRLKVQLLGEDTRVVKVPTDNIAAYESYLRGRFSWNQRTETGLLRSLTYLADAVEADPVFVLALAGLAECYATLGIYGVMHPGRAMPQAEAAANRAIEVDPKTAEAWAARGSARAFFHHDWLGAERDFLRACDVNPQYPTAHQWFAMHCLAPHRRFAEAGARLRRAQELDPLSPAIAASSPVLHYFQGDFTTAASECDALLEKDPTFGLAHYFLGQVLTETGRLGEAIEILRRAVVLTGESPEVESALGFALGRAGDEASARHSLNRLLARSATRYISPVLLAQIYLGLGETGPALIQLEEGYRLRAAELPLLMIKPVFAPLRGVPAFDALVSRIRLSSVTP